MLDTNVLSISPLSGGSIATAYRAQLKDNKTLFVKVSPQHDDMFIKEGNGLNELKKANAIRIPEVIFANKELLALEFLPITTTSKHSGFFECFGSQVALLHRYTTEQYGFGENNYIGSTPQMNLPLTSSWKEFFYVNRLVFQFRLAEQNGYIEQELVYLFRRLEKQFESLIPDDDEAPTLLHGDLWNGNFLCVEDEIPAVIDQAVYYGHREADLAMTMLFGGFGEAFYESYNEAFPLNDEWKRRCELYKLYHLFNHLNLFGEGYYRQLYDTMKFLLK